MGSLFDLKSVGVLGLEPRMTGPESVVLPLHHTPIPLLQAEHPCSVFAVAKVECFFQIPKENPIFF